MTSDAFIAWAMEQPETKRYELFDGGILTMAPQRSAHALTRFHISRRLADLVSYFQRPSLRHNLIVRPENRTVVHHERGDDGIIVARIVRDGPIVLEPPGITLTDCFPPGA